MTRGGGRGVRLGPVGVAGLNCNLFSVRRLLLPSRSEVDCESLPRDDHYYLAFRLNETGKNS